MSQIFISAEIPVAGYQILDQAQVDYRVFQGDGLISKKELLENVADIQVLITPLSTTVDQEVIDAAPHLKLIANYGAGFNNIDSAYAATKNIYVTNTPLVSTNATSELAAGLIIALSRRIVEGDDLMRHEGFSGWAPLFFRGHELAGKTLGIIGMGQIGQALAEKMLAFGMNIIYTQRHPLTDALEQKLHARYVSQSEVIEQADIISIHAPLTDQTQHLFNQATFTKMKNSAFLINAARGPIVDEVALVEALKQNEIAGAALDVFEFEPKVTEALKDFKNVILTPHIGNASFEARDAMADIVVRNALAALNNQPIKYVVNDVK